MKDYLQANREHWNDLTDVHVGPEAYDLSSFIASWKQGNVTDPPGACELGDVTGLSVLHLQCHFGLDTLRLSRLGAKVTGVDLSDRSIAVARNTAAELDVDAIFQQCNVLTLDLADEFDLVYTSLGVLCWLPDLRPWAHVIAKHLKPGGLFYMIENHPFASIFDDEAENELRARYAYFHSDTPFRFDGPGSYAAPDAVVEHSVTYEWTHSIADVLTALLAEKLTIQSYQEFPFCGYQMLPFMIETDVGWVLPDDMKNRLPLAFSVKARKQTEAEQGV